MLTFIRNVRVRQRIMLPNLLAVLLLILLTVLFLFRFNGQEQARAAVEKVGKVESSIHALMQDLLNIETGERGFIISGELAFLEPYQLGKQRFQIDIAKAFSLTRGDVEMSGLLHRLEAQASKLLVTEFDPLVLRRQHAVGTDNEEQVFHQIMAVVSSENGRRQMDQIRQLRDHALDLLQMRLQRNEAIQKSRAENTMVTLLALLLVASLLLLWVGWRTAQRIGNAVESLTVGANAVAGGDLSYQLSYEVSSDEIGALAEALTRMRDHLAATVQRLEQKGWLAEQVDEAGGHLQSVMDQEELAVCVLSILDKQIDVACSAFYALPLSGDDQLQLVSSRNCAADVATVRLMGDGILERCRDDHRVYLLAPVPESYLTVASALGSGAPASVVVIPLAFENRLMAVIELASFRVVSERHIQLLQQLAERISGALYGVRFTMRMEALLVDADASRIELKEKADELEQVSSYKSSFLASMSHEIRTPMNAILGMGELLDETPLNHDQREYLSILRNSGDGLLRIINDILDISKIEAGELTLDPHPFDLLALVEGACEMMAVHAHKKGLELLLHVDDGLPAQLCGDEGRIQQILINLLGNAVKFTATGEVSLRLHLQERFNGADGVTMARLLVEVIDSGIGIPQDKVGLIFRSFTQADSSTTRRFGGTGLGLAISRQLVQKMGGDLQVESREGEGSCFSFTMALGVVGDALALPAPEISTAGRVMLVVDDHVGCREMLAELLSRWGVEVLQAANGAEALALLEQRHSDAAAIDLLLADCDMKEMDGFALVDAVKQRFPHVAELLFMVTTDHIADYTARAHQMGVELMLTKPIRPSALLDLLLALLQRQSDSVDDSTLRVIKGEDKAVLPAHTTETLRVMPKIKILIAEDDRSNQVLISRIMQRWGVDYTMVDNGQEAVLLVQHQPFDLLLMDVNMPVMDGLEATKKIRDREQEQGEGRHLPIVALTALAFAEDERKCLDAGMDLFLTKPIRQKVLSEMVWNMVDDGVIVLSAEGKKRALFDHRRALLVNDGDEALLKMLVQTLHADLPQQLATVGGAVSEGECEQVMRMAHKLKGSLATLGVITVQELAFALESAARNGDADRCREIFSQLEMMGKQLQQELADF